MPVEMSDATRRLGESVLAKLKARARELGIHVDHAIRHYGLECLLRRAGQSAHRDAMVAKGSCVLHVDEGLLVRPTVDVDFGVRQAMPEFDRLEAMLRAVIATTPERDDGVLFDVDSLAVKKERELGGEVGAKVSVMMHLNTVRQRIYIDVQCGAVYTPDAPAFRALPTLLESSVPPVVRVYPVEYTLAEKLAGLVQWGASSSRLKDIWDLDRRIRDVPPERLRDAIVRVAEGMGRELPAADMAGLSAAFAEANQEAYERWAHRFGLPKSDLSLACARIREALGLVFESASAPGRRI